MPESSVQDSCARASLSGLIFNPDDSRFESAEQCPLMHLDREKYTRFGQETRAS